MTAATVQRGRVWLFGDDVPNDGGIMDMEMTRQVVYDPAVLAKHVLRTLDPEFARRAAPGDFVVAGRNFGRGPFHAQGPIGLTGLGVAVLAESTARSFFRIAVSVGLPMLPFAAGVRETVAGGDEIEVDFASGSLSNLTQGGRHAFDPIPAELCEIIFAGGERKWLEGKAAAARESGAGRTA